MPPRYTLQCLRCTVRAFVLPDPPSLTAYFMVTGPIIGMNVVGRSVIVINSLDIARELFEKRSSIYSHRPRMVSTILHVADIHIANYLP